MTTTDPATAPAPLPERPGMYAPPPDGPGGPKAFAVFTVIAGSIIAVGSFTPWITYTNLYWAVSRSGLDMGPDGVVVLMTGLAVLGIGVARLVASPHPVIQRLPILAGGLMIWLAVLDFRAGNTAINFNQYPNQILIYLGAGLYMVMVGAIVAIFGALVVGRRT